MPAQTLCISDWLEIIQAEYREMPGLHLTKAQMQRLWGLDSLTCDALIDALVAARVLRRTATGGYVRASAVPGTRSLGSRPRASLD